ncbi:MAG TPA: hypothetical protein PK948_02740 [Gemmatimonadales bacterium]|jgi:hypothetical protein|nr:hypothetical protein [Gemmatimonadales bacterium]
MARTSFIEHKGVRIAFLDFANVQSTEEALAAIEEAGRIVQAEPFRSVRTLTHVAGSRFNGEVLEAVKLLAVNNRPYVIAGAVVGLSGLQTVVYTTVMRFSKRNIPAFADLEAAKDWLVAQS